MILLTTVVLSEACSIIFPSIHKSIRTVLQLTCVVSSHPLIPRFTFSGKISKTNVKSYFQFYLAVVTVSELRGPKCVYSISISSFC